MHGWISGLVVIIMKVMDHVLGLYFIRIVYTHYALQKEVATTDLVV